MSSLSQEQVELLTRWASFLKAATPVVETNRCDAAQRYIMMYNQLPSDQFAEWTKQCNLIVEFTMLNRDAIVEGNPAKLLKDRRDAFFESTVDCSINVASVLFSCNDPLYANGMWELVRGLVPRPEATAPAATNHFDDAALPPQLDNNFFRTVLNTVQSVTEQQDREDPLSENAPPNVIAERIMRCMRSQQVEGLVTGILQNMNQNSMESMMQGLFGNRNHA